MRERDAVGLRRVGSAVKVFVIGLISGGFLLDGGETGDAVKRIRLYFEPGIGDLLAAAATDAVRMCMEGRKRLLDSAKLFDREHFHGQGDTDLMFSGGLVDRVWEELRFCGDRMGRHGFVCEHRSKSIEFILNFCVIRALSYVGARMFRRNNSQDMVR